MRLIVNADDCGYSEGINQGIIRGFHQGIVSSTTLMVNQPYCQHASALLKGWNVLSVGLHLNLTRGKPLSGHRYVPTLVNEEGYFHPPQLLNRLPIVSSEVETEIEAQLKMIVQLGWLPTHLDAHHHLQCHPVVREAMINVARKHALPMRHFDKEDREAILNAGVATPDHFISSFWDEQATLSHLLYMLRLMAGRCNGKSVVELMTHPGQPDDNVAGSSYYRQRLQELSTLCSPAVRELVRNLNIELVDYRCLTGGTEGRDLRGE